MDAWKAWWSQLPNLEWVHDRAEILGWICAIGIAIALLLMWWTGRIIREHTEGKTTRLESELATTQTTLGKTQTDLQRTRAELEEARRPRFLTVGQWQQLVSAIHVIHPGPWVDVMTLNADDEAFRFGTQMADALREAGWNAQMGLYLTNAPKGLFVLVPHGQVPASARILSGALEQIGFHAPITDNPTPLHGDIGIIVGPKPQ